MFARTCLFVRAHTIVRECARMARVLVCVRACTRVYARVFLLTWDCRRICTSYFSPPVFPLFDPCLSHPASICMHPRHAGHLCRRSPSHDLRPHPQPMLRPRLGAAIPPSTITAAAINRLRFIIAVPAVRAEVQACATVPSRRSLPRRRKATVPPLPPPDPPAHTRTKAVCVER